MTEWWLGRRVDYRDRPCVGCGSTIPDASPWQKKCLPCQFAREARLKAMRRKHHVSPAVKQAVMERDRGQCQKCGVQTRPSPDRYGRDDTPHIDHIRPLVRGGTSAITNLRLLCRRCNLTKGCKREA